MSSFEQTTEFADNLFECKANLVNPEAYREACTAAGGLKNVVVNSHMNIKKENTDILVSVAWFQCVSSSCSIETDLPYIAASQRRDVDFGAALLESPTLAPTYVDGLTFFFAKQQPSDDYYGYSSSSSSDPYGYSSSSSSDPYGYSSSSSSSDPYGYSSSSSSDPYGYYSSSSSSSDPYGYSSSSSDPYGYYSSSSSSDPYGYSSSSSSDPYGYSSSSSSDPYGYYSSSSSSDPYGYSSSSSSDPYGYSSSSSSSDPYGYSSSSSSDPYGYYSSSSSDPYGYSSSSSDPYGYYSSPYPEEDSNEKHHKKEKHHKGSHHSKHDELSSPSTADSAFALLFSSVGVIFVFLMLVIFAVLGLALFRRRSAANNSFALVDEHRYPSKEV